MGVVVSANASYGSAGRTNPSWIAPVYCVPAVPVAVNPDGAERVVVVVVVCSSSVSMAQEMIAKLKQEISNICKILFIFLLHQ